ncbi:uncharacterized protein LOC120818159 [Gasterosteus aculeatus]
MFTNMLTAQFVAGASLFALLFVDICCFPYNQGSNPSSSHVSSYSQAAPAVNANQGDQSVVWPKVPKGVIMQRNPTQPHVGPGISYPTAQRGPAPSVGLSSSSGPISSGFRDPSVRQLPFSSAQPGSAFQPGPERIHMAPPNPNSGGVGVSGIRDVASSFPEEVSPPTESPYKAGELSQFDRSFDYGNNEMETEQRGSRPPPPFFGPASAGQGFAGPLQPNTNIGLGFDFFPSPYYDYMFLTGQYPPGTFSHTSSSYNQGRDYYEDIQYERPGREQPMAPVADFQSPQSIKGPNPRMAGYRQVGAKAKPDSSHRGFRPVSGQAGGRNQVKVGMPSVYKAF